MPRAKPIETRGATTRELADALVVNERHVRELAERGIIPPRGSNGWDLEACRRAYMLHQRAVASGRKRDSDGASGEGDESGRLSLTRETARLNRAKADAEELKLAELRRELVRVGAVREAIVSAWSHVRAHLLAMPTKGAPLLHGLPNVHATKAALEEMVREVLDELASTRSLPVAVDLSAPPALESADAARDFVAALRAPLAALGLEVLIRERKPVRRRARTAADLVDSAGRVGGLEAADTTKRKRVGRRASLPVGRKQRGTRPLAD